MTTVNLNSSALKAKLAAVFQASAIALAEQGFDAAIKASIYEWPRQTKRRNGETVFSPRDIVDTGALLESRKVASKGLTAFFSWEADHAALVLTGYQSATGQSFPARDWVSEGFKRFELLKEVQRRIDGGFIS